MSGLIDIEVVYGIPHKQVLLSLKVPEGTTIENCIKLSGIVKHFPEIVPSEAVVGIFSKPDKLDNTVKQGDRIEIYRPLTADPKEMRKLRAEKAKQAKKNE
ncbi:MULTISPECIES: RnfH family protein [Psychromonas]|uniref:RnfH family protein n=1 Tax=Psychromonas TaxID=67572 RepID=UPI000429A198|nr:MULTISPECIES: RnfH family protein [Psychromonas]MBB1272564.1 RnfH family protein [Psychromonas sp. SR45-3]